MLRDAFPEAPLLDARGKRHEWQAVVILPFVRVADLEAALPDMTSTFTAAGLDGAVEIIRDNFGVPHIKVRPSPSAPHRRIFAPA